MVCGGYASFAMRSSKPNPSNRVMTKSQTTTSGCSSRMLRRASNPSDTCLLYTSNVIQGALVGAALALLLPLSGAGKRKEPFGNLLWLPALLLALVVGYQYGAASLGWQAPLLSLLTTRNGQVIWIECAFIGYMTITCLRTRP